MSPEIPRVLVLTGDHGLPDPTKPGAVYSALDLRYHEAMREGFESRPGYRFEFLTEHARLLDRLRDDPPDLVVNFCDTGYRNRPELELHVPALLEMLGIPFTGSGPAALALAFDKAAVRLLAAAAGIPVPAEIEVDPAAAGKALEDFCYPAMVKPNRADGSVGIDRDSVAGDARAARAALARLARRLPGATALLQEYLPGREFGIGLLGNPGRAPGLEPLPPYEVDYSGLPAGLAPILAYESKTIPASPYWTGVRIRRAEVDAATLAAMIEAARRMFSRLGLRDYARFDFRTAADGTVRLMEANPNPAWDCEAKLALMAGFAGMSYADLLGRILEVARARDAAGR